MKKKILLIGGGGHCRSIIDVIELQEIYEIAGIIDKKELMGQAVLGYPIIGCDEDLTDLFKQYQYAVITVGQIRTPDIRVEIFNRLKDIGYTLPVIKSSLSYVSKHAFVDEGTVIMHHALINANVKIGKNCIINTKALIEHDCIIENNSHISTATVVNGGVTVKEGTFFGSNATSKEAVILDGFIKAGSVIK